MGTLAQSRNANINHGFVILWAPSYILPFLLADGVIYPCSLQLGEVLMYTCTLSCNIRDSRMYCLLPCFIHMVLSEGIEHSYDDYKSPTLTIVLQEQIVFLVWLSLPNFSQRLNELTHFFSFTFFILRPFINNFI